MLQPYAAGTEAFRVAQALLTLRVPFRLTSIRGSHSH